MWGLGVSGFGKLGFRFKGLAFGYGPRPATVRITLSRNCYWMGAVPKFQCLGVLELTMPRLGQHSVLSLDLKGPLR